MKLRVEPLHRVAGGFEYHLLQIVAEDFIAAALKDAGSGEGFFEQFVDPALYSDRKSVV